MSRPILSPTIYRIVALLAFALLAFACGDNLKLDTPPDADRRSDGQLSSAKELTALSFTTAANPALSADVTTTISGTAVAATVPNGTDLTALVATFATTGASVRVGTTDQVSDTTANDFASPVVYTVVAEDGSTQDYTVTISIEAPSSAKAITAFAFRTSSNATLPATFDGTIDEGAGTIAVRVPTGTNRAALIASFTHTGATIAVGVVPQIDGVTPNNFTSPVIYRVTAEDDSFKDYTVTVSEAAYCGSRAAPTGGEVTVTNQGFAPATATYSCELGRALVSADGATRSCDAPSNAWDPASVPTCVPTVLVLRVGNGTNPLTNASTAVFLEERVITDGSVVQVISLPTAVAGANQPLTLAGTSNTEGALSTSADGRYVTFGGYAAEPGAAMIASSASATTARVIGRIRGTDDPQLDTTTLINDALSATSIRAATTDDGTGYWAVGGNSGVRFATHGGTGASTAISTGSPIVNLRSVHIAGDQLYVSTSSMTLGVHAIGTGKPTTTGQNATVVANTGTGVSPHGFAFLDLDSAVAGVDTLYIGINEPVTLGINRINIQKWTFNGTTWTQNALFLPVLTGQNVGVQGLTAFRVDGQTHILATTAPAAMSSSNNLVVHLVDDGVNLLPAATSFGAAGMNAGYRGVARSPYTP